MNQVPPPQAPPKPRPYRRVLNSVLHARFLHAAFLSLLLSWDNAVFLHPKRDLLWSWFPLGPAGLKTLIFFLSNLFVFVLLIGTVSVGRSISRTPFARFRTSLLSRQAIFATICFLASASWFAEAYIWTSSGLGWITRGNMTTPDKLNEEPIYLRFFFMLMGLLHTVQHLYFGQSNLHLPVAPPPTPQSTDRRTHPIEDPFTQIKAKAVPMLLRSTVTSIAASALGPFIYGLFLRQLMWKVHLAIAKPFFNLSRSNARATGYPPLLGILLPSLAAGFFLNVTWEMTSILFIVMWKKPPTKKDVPLSSASKDPNGTLLIGLRAKSDITKTFAFWEMALIAQNFPERRKAIFSDIDRATGPVWTSMMDQLLKVLQAVDDRISPPADPKPVPSQQPTADSLPKLLPEVPANNIFAGRPAAATAGEKVKQIASSEAQKLGSSPKPWKPPYDRAGRLLEQRAESVASPLEQLMGNVKKSPIGTFFRTKNAAMVNAKVLGTPHGNAAILVDAIEAVTKMLTASLQEDPYGKVVACVPVAVKQFTKTINLIEKLVQDCPSDSSISEVEIVLARLRAGLIELLSAFQTFLVDTGLGIGDLESAKRASGQKTIDKEPERRPKQIENAPAREALPEPPKGANAEEGWRSWGKQRNAENVQPLFPNRTERRKEPRVVHVPRRREMEQVR